MNNFSVSPPFDELEHIQPQKNEEKELYDSFGGGSFGGNAFSEPGEVEEPNKFENFGEKELEILRD